MLLSILALAAFVIVGFLPALILIPDLFNKDNR